MSRITEKNTKADIMKAYNLLLKEKQTVESQLRSTEKALDKANEIALKAQAGNQNNGNHNGNGQHNTVIQEKIITKIVEVPAFVDNIQGIISTLDGIDKGLGNATGNIAAQLTIEADNLAILLKEKNEALQTLEQMYGLKSEEGMADLIIEEYETLFEAYEAAYTLQDENFEEEAYQLRKNWKKEQFLKEEADSEKLELDLQEQQRENEQYEYDIVYARNLEEDGYNQKIKLFLTELEEIREKRVEEWTNKEKEINLKEKDFEDYKNKFEEIPARLEKETKKAEAEGKGIIEKDTKVKTDLLAKDSESKNQIYEIKIQALKDHIGNQEGQLGSLSKQLENALKQVQELAVKAIEGASRTESFDALREIALEQSKAQQKNK